MCKDFNVGLYTIQPVYNITSKRVMSNDAVLRAKHRKRGFVSMQIIGSPSC